METVGRAHAATEGWGQGCGVCYRTMRKGQRLTIQHRPGLAEHLAAVDLQHRGLAPRRLVLERGLQTRHHRARGVVTACRVVGRAPQGPMQLAGAAGGEARREGWGRVGGGGGLGRTQSMPDGSFMSTSSKAMPPTTKASRIGSARPGPSQ